jgi:hypothetical protein
MLRMAMDDVTLSMAVEQPCVVGQHPERDVKRPFLKPSQRGDQSLVVDGVAPLDGGIPTR